MKKSRSRKIIVVFIILILSIYVINKQDIIYNFNNINSKNAMQTNYDTITDFQNARWTDIQNNIFGEGVAKNTTDTNLATAKVIEGNSYFNWVDTSSLGIIPWDGTANKSDGTEYKISDFYGSENKIEQENVKYTTEIVQGVIDTRDVTYEVYNIENANQLYYVLNAVATTKNNKKIYINNDIDLGGQNGMIWPSVYTSSGEIYIEGNGHTIYNLNSNVNGLFSTMNAKTTIENLNMKSVKVIGKSNSDKVSPIGRPMSSGYRFENIHIDGGFIQSKGSDTCGFISRPGSVNTFVKDCSTSNMYIYGAGQHTSGFIGCVSGAQNSFSGGYGVRYDVEYPSQPEALFGNSSTTLNTTDSRYPFYITDCYSIDCEIFSTSGHSGGFISCMDSGVICKNSFCNNSIYGEDSTGVFIGCQVGYSWGPFYDDTNAQTINAYFENCYTSGVVEGTTSIGGFVGSDLDKKAGTIYKNCYSTSMVGMDYSGEGVGGFIGSTANSGTINVSGLGKLNGIIMINCYAAGEVGNIDTATDIETAKSKKIGGFLGEYTSRANQLNFYNCYYDKQTTAMREVAVGMQGNGQEACQLNGVTGVYTQESIIKGVQGLTNVDMQDGDSWVYKEGYYPQLKAFVDDANNFTNNELVQSYSTASTATVFLDHWDNLMVEDGQIQSRKDAKEIYDTIRDITSTFEFTSNENSNSSGYDITWQVDSETNSTKGYVEELKITQEDGTEKKVPVLSIQNPVKNREEGLNFGLEVKDIYKCYDFAPGKSWVKIEAKNTIGNNVVGTRKLRLLPTAYIDAGEYAEVTLVTDNLDEGRVVENSIEINGQKIDATTYKHAQDTMYVITDSENLGDNKIIYPGQIVTKEESTPNLFALWSRYPDDENTSDVTTKKFDEMYNQALIGNSKDTGLAKVEVYSLGIIYRETEDGAQIPVINYDEKKRVTSDTLNDQKWRGEELFTEEDTGWYELKYYWRLNDGRYLTDSKIVVIKGNEVSATLNNNIIKGQKDYNDGILKIAPDIKQNTEDAADLNTNYEKDEEEKRGVETTINDNGTVQKTIKVKDFVSDKLIVGWANDENYKLEDLKVEVSKDGAAWVTLPLDLNTTDNTEYTYLSQDWKVKQYTDTKEYYIESTGEPVEVTLQASYIKDDNNDYIKFNFKINDKVVRSINNSNIRVTATFVPLEDLTIVKEWVDNDNALGIRPVSIVLKAVGSDGKEYKGETNSAQNWKTTLKVPTYDVNENEITYTVDEENVPEQYEKKVDNENKKITNELIKYNITTKVDGVGGTISGQNEQIYEEVTYKSDSTKDIVITPEEGYEISSIKINGVEQQLPEYSLRDEPYVLDKFQDVTENKEIIVTFRENKVDVLITKVWNDNNNENGKRPSQISVILKNNNSIVAEKLLDVNDSNSQTVLFENLNKYDEYGNEIAYVVDEEEVNVGDFEFYTKEVKGTIITNTYTVPDRKTSITVTKNWNDNNNITQKRPQSILVDLKNENEEIIGTQTLSDTNNWTYTFDNLQKYNNSGNEIEYTVDEREVNTGDLYFYSKSIDNNNHIITNTFTVPDEKINITANKVWNDNSNEMRKRPTSVILQIKNGDIVVQSKTVTSATNWSCEFTDLDKYDDLGNEIHYTLDEQEVNKGDLKFYEKQIDNSTYTITNNFKIPDETTSIQVTKIWEDNDNIAQKRPQSIQIQIKNGQEVVKTQTITGDSNVWTTQIDGLRKYDDRANEIRYTIDEISIDFYKKQVNGYIVTNTFNVPEDKVNMQVTKIWEDNSNENGVRPKNITLIIKEGMNEIKREEVGVTKDEQVYLIEGLDKYDEYGNEKEYSVDEEIVEGYNKKVEGNIITNSIKKYKITTEVIGVGGTISGQEDAVYEEVSYGGESKKEIVIIPEEGYKISSIKINGEEIEFIPSEEKYVLEKFVDIKEDKHIEVEFESVVTSVIVKYVDENGEKLAEDVLIEGKVGDEYKTQAKEFGEYEVKEIIGNEQGQMTTEQITVTYVYKKVVGSIEITKVDKNDNSKVIEGAVFKIEKIDTSGNIDTEFEAKEMTTGSNGKVLFEGLEVGKYRVTEIKAPENYELQKESIEVEVTKENRDIKLVAENELKLILPETGSINYTAIFAISGLLIISVSIILNKKSKVVKMKK